MPHHEAIEANSMKDELIKLVTLQKFDGECRDIEKHIEEAYEKIKQDELRLAKAEQQLEDKKIEQRNKQMHYDRLDQDIKAFESRMKEYNFQLMSLKDQKSYDAMRSQIQELREEMGGVETEGFEVLDELEKLQETTKLYTEKIEEEHKRIEELKVTTETDLQEKKAELEELMKKRDSYTDNISASNMKIYNRLLGLPNGKPMAIVEDRACTGCYSTITLEDLETIKMSEKLITCNSCGRILYIPAHLGAAEVS